MPNTTLLTIALLLPSPVLGQSWSQWTPTGGPPTARELHSAIYDANAGQMIIFAGYSGGYLNDVWSLNTSGSGAWVQLSPTGAAPTTRYGHSAVYDATNSRMVIFGGNGAACTNDVWVLSNANRVNGVPAWTQFSPSGFQPPARLYHQAVYDPNSNRMIVFGGQECGFNAPVLDDVWVLSNANGLGGSPTWTELSPTGGPPPPTELLSAVYDSASNRMTLYGGWDGGFLSTVWVLSSANGLGGSPSWTQVSPTESLPVSLRSSETRRFGRVEMV
jgi:hypothetical protein